MNNDFIRASIGGKITPEEITGHKSQGDASLQQLEKIIEKSYTGYVNNQSLHDVMMVLNHVTKLSSGG